MPDVEAISSPSPAPAAACPRGAWLAVAALLAMYAVMAFTASLGKGVSFDEGEQLAVGYNLWVRGDYRIEGANGDLVKRWATLPYLISRPNFVGVDDPYWQAAEPYLLAKRFFFEIGNQPEALLRQGRAMMALMGMALGLLVFIWARELFGVAGGFVALAVFAFSPNLLAFGGIVSTDLTIALTLPASAWCIWRLLHVVSCSRVLASLAMFGLLLLAKPTALVIFPVTAVLIAVKLIAGGPLRVRWRGREWTLATRGAQARVFGACVLLHAVCGWATLWAHYGFRYRASPDPANPALILRPQLYRDHVPDAIERFVNWSHRTHFFPEGYRVGIDRLLGNDDQLRSFMAGEWRTGGRWDFFPYAMWVKTRPALFLLLLLAGVAWWRTHRASAAALYPLAPWLALIFVYLGFALTEDINLGHRHVLPLYPVLYVFTGAAVLAWQRWAWTAGALIAALLGWLTVDSLAIRPHYLAYFGPQAGGPAAGYHCLVDSSLDWGMNLPGLKRWLAEHNPGDREPVFLAYFGTDDPDHYGIKSRRLPGFPDWRPPGLVTPAPGYYAISASLLQGVYTRAFGAWSEDYENAYRSALLNFRVFDRTAPGSPERVALFTTKPPGFWDEEFKRFEHLRFARLCAWLRHHGPPTDHVGYAILIWKLDYAALEEALFGPPAELVHEPARYFPQ